MNAQDTFTLFILLTLFAKALRAKEKVTRQEFVALCEEIGIPVFIADDLRLDLQDKGILRLEDDVLKWITPMGVEAN